MMEFADFPAGQRETGRDELRQPADPRARYGAFSTVAGGEAAGSGAEYAAPSSNGAQSGSGSRPGNRRWAVSSTADVVDVYFEREERP